MQLAMQSLPPCSALALCLLVLACEFPVATSKYDTEPTASTTSGLLQRLRRAFAAGDHGCLTCLESSCREQFSECAQQSGCVEFAECTLRKASPAANAECTASQGVPFEALERYTNARECWSSCYRECATGADWSCVGNYTTPRPPKDTITIAQTFNYVGLGWPIPGIEVRFCGLTGSCNPEVAVTDDAGRYRVELPIAVEAGLEGWHGARLLDNGGIDSQALVHNVPLWSDHSERTYLMPAPFAKAKYRELAELVGQDPDDAEQPILWTQVFDCQTSEAVGIELSMPTAPDASIVYANGSDLDLDATATAAGQGSAVIFGIPIGQEHEIEARRATNGERVARGSVYVSGKQGIILNLMPNPVPN